MSLDRKVYLATALAAIVIAIVVAMVVPQLDFSEAVPAETTSPPAQEWAL